MSESVSFDSFQAELGRLVETFGRNLAAYKGKNYDEASLRQEFLNPFFRALGWDIENKAGLIPQHREVEIESRTPLSGRQNRADYLFRTHPTDRFVCEAKKPSEELHARHAYQAKCYAWSKGLPLAILTDFEELKVFVVGGRPELDEPDAGLWQQWSFRDYPQVARDIWNLLARERVAGGSIEQLLESLPKQPVGKGKPPKGWVVRPDRSRSFDADFLSLLDAARRELAADLLKHNDRADLLEGDRLNEAVHHILDRLLFLRICEDRDIDTGRPLERLVRNWREDSGLDFPRAGEPQPFELREEPPEYHGARGLRAPKGTLWHSLVRHFRALDRRPPSHFPFFDGNLFKPHFSEELVVSDEWLVGFLDRIGEEHSPYRFNYVPVEILGTIYERFLGKVVRPQGRGATIEEKPEVRKAGGVYYTPRYIVEYIVAQTVGKLLEGKPLEEALKLRILDPACGSGSFLIRAFEVVCEHCQQWLTDDLRRSRGNEAQTGKPQEQRLLTSSPTEKEKGWLKKHRNWCWYDEAADALHLTTKAKRRILRETIYGVDLDPQAVEVTQLSLYLKMLEGENRATLARERDLFGDEEALLPPLEANIKCGNSLIASDFSMIPEDLVRVRAFDWPVQFPAIMKAGGFDAVIGNPPYVLISPEMFDAQVIHYLRRYEVAQFKADLFHLFIQRGFSLMREKGRLGMIVPHTWLTLQFTDRLRHYLVTNATINELVIFDHRVFQQADVFTALLFLDRHPPDKGHEVIVRKVAAADSAKGIAQCHANRVPQWHWAGNVGCVFETRLTGREGQMVERLRRDFPPLSSVVRASLGCQAYNRSKHTREQIEKRVFHADRKLGKNYLPELAGNDVGRYEIHRERGRWIKYGPWLHDYRTMDWLKGPRILIREIPGPQPRSIMATYVEDTFCNYKTILNVNPSEQTTFSMKYLLGILNSRLLSFLYPYLSNKLVAKAFPRLSVGDVKRLPIAVPNLKNLGDKARHTRLVELVDKMLALVPKLRAAKTEAERATLQNAVTATDREIDALVYELYGLTEEEIKLVEAGDQPPPPSPAGDDVRSL